MCGVFGLKNFNCYQKQLKDIQQGTLTRHIATAAQIHETMLSVVPTAVAETTTTNKCQHEQHEPFAVDGWSEWVSYHLLPRKTLTLPANPMSRKNPNPNHFPVALLTLGLNAKP